MLRYLNVLAGLVAGIRSLLVGVQTSSAEQNQPPRLETATYALA